MVAWVLLDYTNSPVRAAKLGEEARVELARPGSPDSPVFETGALAVEATLPEGSAGCSLKAVGVRAGRRSSCTRLPAILADSPNPARKVGQDAGVEPAYSGWKPDT